MAIEQEFIQSISVLIEQATKNTTKIYKGILQTADIPRKKCNILINDNMHTISYYGGTPIVGEVYRVFVPENNMSNAFIITNNNDFVVEQGTSDIWTYRKWHSGIAECWARTQVHTASWSTYGNVYQCISENVSFPSNFFTAKPNLIPSAQGSLASFNYRYTQSTKDAFSVGIVSGYQYATGTVLDIFVVAIGRWK